MNFASDNWAGAHPAIGAMLARKATEPAPAYGESDLDRQAERRFCEVFERDVAAFFVGTGTAANALSFAAFQKPGGVVLCHRDAHAMVDECGAPEFLGSGTRLAPVDGAAGVIEPAALERELSRFRPGFVHAGRPVGVSISQPTESGVLYKPAEIRAIADIAKERGLPLHMDGARLANALAAGDASPAEMTWKAGVDVLSFGGTKNGCWCAEAVIFFDRGQARDFPFIRKRSAQLFSKSRFIAAQFLAYFEDGLWLEMAAHANAMADRLRAGFEPGSVARLAWPTGANEIFVILPLSLIAALREAGANFYEWDPPRDASLKMAPGEGLIRLVTSWSTERREVEGFLLHLAHP